MNFCRCESLSFVMKSMMFLRILWNISEVCMVIVIGKMRTGSWRHVAG